MVATNFLSLQLSFTNISKYLSCKRNIKIRQVNAQPNFCNPELQHNEKDWVIKHQVFFEYLPT